MGSASHLDLLAAAGGLASVLAALPPIIQAARRGKAGAEKEGTTKHFEFGGPAGAYSTMFALPGVIALLYCTIGETFTVPGFDLLTIPNAPLPHATDFVSIGAVTIFAGWMFFQVLLERFLPATIEEGVDLAPAGGKGKLKYRINAHLAFWVSVIGAFFGRKHMSKLYDEYLALAGVSVIFSTGLSAYLYASSFAPGALLAKGGNSGNSIYDFFIGRELNPRIFGGTFDLKQFCELRPGLIGWVMLNLGMAAKQHEITGSVSGPMMLVNAFQGLYVWDALYQERAILSTMDITTDGFGYMLAFGDLAWVPFTYGLQARYLVHHDPKLSKASQAIIGLLGLGAYWIFRGANSEKDAFRRDPTAPGVKHLKTLKVKNQQTGKETSLLISGWWGLARKINYTGDWLMAWCWSATTGIPTPGGANTVMTYFYPIYFAILLIHRAWRDDEFCHEKYGEGWTQYKKHVPKVFFPYIV